MLTFIKIKNVCSPFSSFIKTEQNLLTNMCKVKHQFTKRNTSYKKCCKYLTSTVLQITATICFAKFFSPFFCLSWDLKYCASLPYQHQNEDKKRMTPVTYCKNILRIIEKKYISFTKKHGSQSLGSRIDLEIGGGLCLTEHCE